VKKERLELERGEMVSRESEKVEERLEGGNEREAQVK
jgi:hypothetical protein